MPMLRPAATEQHFTYGDYCRWPDDERWELINGRAHDMCPAPARKHQELVVEIVRQLGNQLEGADCRVYVAPFDVRLPEADEADEAIENVVQPDVVVVCDPAKLDDAGCRGAPDWIIEVLSPSTAAKDQTDKLALYERHGVREYWLVHPTDRVLTIYRSEGRGYGRPLVLPLSGETDCAAVPGLRICWPAPETRPARSPGPGG
jgi:Uma2 family endonuclease